MVLSSNSKKYLLLGILAIFLFACHRKSIPEGNLRTETGYASYYSDKMNGHQTANGDIFNNSIFTAAHKKLPFGTKVKVTNLSNGKSVVVRINDRGPFVAGRIIDLTKAAAASIGMVSAGIAKVTIEYKE
jgi:rare lipoprotein A